LHRSHTALPGQIDIIMKKNKVRPGAIAVIALCAIPSIALAQQPPQLEKLEEGEPPAVTIRKPEQKSAIQEKRAPGGKVTEVKVSTGGSTYVVKPNDQAGSALPGDTQSHTFRPPQWQVKEFDLGRRGEQNEAAEGEERQAAPPPPQAPQK
jgi:hypothetical protein